KLGFAVARYQSGPRSGPLFSVTGFPSTATAGAVKTITVIAEDTAGNPNPGYAGAIHFTSSDPMAVLPGDYVFTAADHGVHVFSVTLKTSGFQSVSVTDIATGYAGGDGAITINAAAATQLILSAPASVNKGSAFSITVTALDPFGNVTTGYA